MKKNIKYIVIVALIVATAFVGGCTIGKESEAERIENKIRQLKSVISAYYLDDADDQKLEEGIYKGLVKGLDDPYSVYYTEEEYKELQEDVEGTYVGIGVSVRQDSSTGYLTVINAFEDGSAYKAGVRAGDIILEIDGQTVKDEDPDQAVTRIRGEEGTTVSVKYKSVSQGKTIT
ncbi:MAG: PDZ domain-containing protein, partial [Lachnospiraceae bacterium]|nr:PDZ domain-containing protein [Lachnospiraceae bacterium]